MSKYHALWEWIDKNRTDSFTLTFAQIAEISGIPIDHSFLRCKKELTEYGWEVKKISMKDEKVTFEKC